MRGHQPLRLVPKTWSGEGGERTTDSPFAYDVAGLPDSLSIEIAEMNGRWRLLVVRDGIHGDWQGDFDSAEQALAAIEQELAQPDPPPR